MIWPGRHHGRLLGLAALAVVLAWAVIALRMVNEAQHRCEDTELARLPSPDGAWVAVRVEEHCPAAMGGDSLTTGVTLRSARGPTRAADLLGMDTDGRDDGWPRVAWTAPGVVRITVPNAPWVSVLRRRFEGVRVDLQYDPPDPLPRAERRRPDERAGLPEAGAP